MKLSVSVASDRVKPFGFTHKVKPKIFILGKRKNTL